MRSAIILSSFPRNAVLFWVLLFFSLSPHCAQDAKMSEKRMCKQMLYFPQHGWKIYYGKRILEPAASSMSSCFVLQKISAQRRSPVHLPDTARCPGAETLLPFAPVIPLLSHGSRLDRRERQPPFCTDSILPLSLPQCAKDFCVLLCLISFVEKQNKTKRKKKILGTLEDKEGEARGNRRI